MLKVGIISFINSLPYSAAFELKAVQSANIQITSAPPTALNRALRAGHLDVSFISAAEYLEQTDRYVLLPDFCIGARERVGSVLLYMRRTIAEMDKQPVGLTPLSASAVLLLKLLCDRFWKVQPHFDPNLELARLNQYEAILLCGDECLERPQLSGFQTLDMASAWYHATGKPFTFAVLAARKEVADERPHEITNLRHCLRDAYSWSLKHRDEIERIAQTRCHLSQKQIREYYQLLRYEFDEEQQQGLQQFSDLLEETHVQRALS